MTAHTYGDTLTAKGLQPFLWTQFLGAFNDNLFKIVVSMLAVHAATSASPGRQRSLAGVRGGDPRRCGTAARAGRRRLHPAVSAVPRVRGPACRHLQQADGAG